MNRARWENVSEITLDCYLAKLIEEVGEVAKELNDLRDFAPDNSQGVAARYSNVRKANRIMGQLTTEIEHVQFIAAQLAKRAGMEQKEITVQMTLRGR